VTVLEVVLLIRSTGLRNNARVEISQRSSVPFVVVIPLCIRRCEMMILDEQLPVLSSLRSSREFWLLIRRIGKVEFI